MSLIPFILDLADELHEFSRCLANGIDINDFGFGLYTGTDQQQPQQHQHQQQQQQQQQQQPQVSPRRSRTSSFSSFWMPSKRHHPYNRIKTACCAKAGEEGTANPEKSEASSSSIGGTPGKSASYSVVNKNGFQVSMNVKQFAPNELSVKTIDNCIVVEGRHDDKEDGHGVISRHFVRKYMLPKGYDPNDVLSTLSSDGILTVKAPPPPPPTAKNDEPSERVIEIQPTPGPTPVLVVSAKDTPAKETTKKLTTTPSARLECQLPEKRQKLDLPPEPQPEESTETPVPIPTSATSTGKESDSASTPLARPECASNDVEMEKTDEQITEIVIKHVEQQPQPQQQTSDVAENDVEKKKEIIEQSEKLSEKEQEKISGETEKKLLGENMTESTNGDSKNVYEKMEEQPCIDAADAAEVTEKINATPVEAKIQKSVENVTQMEVDGENEDHHDDEEKIDNTKIVVATFKTADSEKKTTVTAATCDDSAKKTDTDTANSKTATTTTTIVSNNNNNSNTNRSSSNTNNNSSPEVITEISEKDIQGGNGVVTGEIPLDIPIPADSDAAAPTAVDTTTTTNKTKVSADKTAESLVDEEIKTETAVLSTDTTTTSIIDDVALLKAATADPTATIDDIDGNVILTESMDGITTTTDMSTTASNINTITTTVDNVECSLFAKKSHLGNGNNTTATPLVGTEEMAN